MIAYPHHPFVDYPNAIKTNTIIQTNQPPLLTRELFESIEIHPISPNKKSSKTEDKKPNTNDELLKAEQKYPKIRVSLEVFNQLKQIQKQKKCKSFCEVVSKLLESYEDHDNSSSSIRSND